MALFGHIVRAVDTDPIRTVVLKPGMATPILDRKKRPGRPRTNWTLTHAEAAWEITKTALQLPEERYDPESVEHSTHITTAAHIYLI